MGLKTVSIIMVIVCGTLIGFELRLKLSVRVRSLEMFRTLFLDMKSMISHSGLTLDDMIFDMSGRYPNNNFISKACEYIHYNSFREAWKLALKDLQGSLCITESDTSLLIDCANMMGKCDVEGELDSLQLINERLSLAVEEARSKLNSDGKIYATVGCSCGIIVALLLV